MTDWTLTRWHGAPEILTAALRALGWHGPGEEPGAFPDPSIGGFIPAPGEAPRVLDGIAYAAVLARGALPTPPGLAETGAELSSALLGSF